MAGWNIPQSREHQTSKAPRAAGPRCLCAKSQVSRYAPLCIIIIDAVHVCAGGHRPPVRRAASDQTKWCRRMPDVYAPHR